MLNDEEAVEMTAWVRAANSWSLAAQAIVRTSTDLATQSRDLADRLETGQEASLTAELRVLAEAVEDDSQELRDRYLGTAEALENFHDVLGGDGDGPAAV